MDITWQGSTCLWVQTGDDIVVVDPFEKSLLTSKRGEKAGIVVVSYGDVPNGVPTGNQMVLDGPGEFEIGKFYVTGVGSPHTGPEGERDVNTMFSIRADGVTICHLGHLDQIPNTKSIDTLGQPEVVFLPLEPDGVLSAAQTAEVIGLIGPRIAVPLLISNGQAAEDPTLKELLGALGVAEVDQRNRLNVTETNLPRDLSVVALDKGAP